MDIETMMKIMNDARIESAGNLTIGKMLKKLNQFSNDDKVLFTNGKFYGGGWDSYRGYYEDFALGCSDEDQGFNTVGNIKEALNDALEAGIMYGYKGGEFSITDDTLVWFARYGCTEDMIVDVQKINESIYIITKENE
jgi:hypothetical protein